MIGKFLMWIGVWCVILLLWVYLRDITIIFVLVTGGIIIVIGYIYSANEIRQEIRILTHR